MILWKMINLLSKTGLGRSGHVRFQTFGPIWHVSIPKMVFWRNDLMILHHFCWRSSNMTLFWPKTLKYNQKLKHETKNPKIIQKYFRLILSRLAVCANTARGPHRILQLYADLAGASYAHGPTALQTRESCSP